MDFIFYHKRIYMNKIFIFMLIIKIKNLSNKDIKTSLVKNKVIQFFFIKEKQVKHSNNIK